MTTEIIADKTQIPWFRRPLQLMLLYFLITPIALVILVTGPNYYFARGGYKRMGMGLKSFLVIAGSLYLLFQLGRILAKH